MGVRRLGKMAARSDAARQTPPGRPGLEHTTVRPPSDATPPRYCRDTARYSTAGSGAPSPRSRYRPKQIRRRRTPRAAIRARTWMHASVGGTPRISHSASYVSVSQSEAQVARAIQAATRERERDLLGNNVSNVNGFCVVNADMRSASSMRSAWSRLCHPRQSPPARPRRTSCLGFRVWASMHLLQHSALFPNKSLSLSLSRVRMHLLQL